VARNNRSFLTCAIIYSVLLLFSNISANITGEYVARSTEEVSLLAAAGKDEPQDFPELIENIHQQVNEFRQAQGRRALRLNSIISAQARQHSLEMARKGSAINHKGFGDRLKRIGEKLSFRAGAENIASSTGYENPVRTAVEGWKTSPGHRKNMLGDFTLTGIGIAQSEQGSYFITQIFFEPLQ
jgi:uncharacterized protein YkwD